MDLEALKGKVYRISSRRCPVGSRNHETKMQNLFAKNSVINHRIAEDNQSCGIEDDAQRKAHMTSDQTPPLEAELESKVVGTLKIFYHRNQLQNAGTGEYESVQLSRALESHSECDNAENLSLEIVSERVNVLYTDRHINDQVGVAHHEHHVEIRKVLEENMATDKARDKIYEFKRLQKHFGR